MERVKAIAFTDSVHSLSHHRADKKLRAWMKKVLGTDTGIAEVMGSNCIPA